MDLKSYLSARQQLIDQQLQALLPLPAPPFARHLEAMRYSLFSGGKRLRPLLCLAAAEAVTAPEQAAQVQSLTLPVAAALECIHSYSLIHDDLPAMDNDDLRRGRPTNHKVYGEAEAILAGDGLLTWAFDLLSGPATAQLPAEVRVAVIQVIARAAGSLGMVGGQSLDMIAQGQEGSAELLHQIHRSKTGALITASLLAGSLVAQASDDQRQALQRYGEQIGLAFQIVDDLLDLEATAEELGKTAGKDVSAGKLTFPAIYGQQSSHDQAAAAMNAALAALADFDSQAEPLRALARYIVTRRH